MIVDRWVLRRESGRALAERLRLRTPLEKLRGCIAASPRVQINCLEEAYLFFFAAFFFAAMLYLLSIVINFPPALLAERVFNSHV